MQDIVPDERVFEFAKIGAHAKEVDLAFIEKVVGLILSLQGDK